MPIKIIDGQYNKKNIQKEYNMKVTSDRGSTFLKDNLKAHEATIKHKTYLTNKDMKNAGKNLKQKLHVNVVL